MSPELFEGKKFRSGSVAIVVLRNNRGGRRQNINRECCIISD